MEGRGRRSHEPLEGNMTGTSRPETVSTKQQRIAELAQERSGDGIHVPGPPHRHRLAASRPIQRTRKDGAVGRGRTDGGGLRGEPGGQPPGRCWTAPSPARTGHRRCGGCTSRRGLASETRPLGIPTFEDKVLQRAVVMVLEPVYEQDFSDCSYGFRPGRSAHQALEALRTRRWRWGRLDRGGGHPEVLRHAGSWPSCGAFCDGYATGCCCD